MRFLLSILLITVSVTPLLAQDSFAVRQEDNISPELIFRRYTSEEGLPDNRIRSIFQDSKGYLWLCTMNGLARYDGYTFKKFDANENERSIAGNWTHAICEDASQNLWMGTGDGLNFYDVKTDQFTRFVHDPNDKNSLFSNRITSLVADKQGKIWIGTEDGLANFQPATGQFKTLTQAPFNTNICTIIESYDDYIWIATRNGLVHYNVKTDTYKYYPSTIAPNIHGDTFWSLYEDDRNLYIGTTSRGLVRLPYQKQTQDYGNFEYLNKFSNTKDHLENDEIFDICKSSTGDFWLATARGLAKIENLKSPNSKLSFQRNNPINNKSLSDNTVYQVFIDKNKILWCGTELGLNKLDLDLLPFRYYTFKDSKSLDQVRSVFTRDGVNIWVGSSLNGVYRYNLNTNATVSYQFRHDISRFNFNRNRSIFIEDTGKAWFGTLGGAISFDIAEPSRLSQKFDNKGIYTYLKDSSNNLWLGTNKGLIKIDKNGTEKIYTAQTKAPHRLSGNLLRHLYEDRSGRVWIGLETAGLNIYLPEKDAFLNFNELNSQGKLLGNTVSSITEYPKNVFWVGTDAGLNKIQVNRNQQGEFQLKIKNYSEASGLPDKAVSGVMADDLGYIWVSTIKGLLRFDTTKEQFHNFLPNLNFNFSCAYKYSSHQFIFGTSDGFVVFDPHNVSTDDLPPQVVISDLKLFNQPVQIDSLYHGQVLLKQSLSHTKEVHFSHKNNVFTIGFTGLHFSNPENNIYAYKMEGFDTDWIYTKASNRSATYTNLDPGTYYFQVRASSGLGVWNKDPSVIKVVIQTPPWRTWWAVLLYFILALSVLLIIIRHLLIQAQQKQQIEFDEKEIAQLKNLHHMKMEFFTDISHEFRTPLSLIVGPVEDMLRTTDPMSGTVKKKLQLVYRNCKSLLFLIDELVTFQKFDQGMLKLALKKMDPVEFTEDICTNFELLAQKNAIDFEFSSQVAKHTMWFDPGKLEMVLNNLIFNAFKFSNPGGQVKVQMYTVKQESPADKPWLCISIEDNGKGIPKDEITHIFDRFYQGNTNKRGSGVGLSLSKSLIELHKGVITVESQPNIRTRFTVFLPLSTALTQTPQEVKVSKGSMPLFVDGASLAEVLGGEIAEEDKGDLLIVDDNEEVLAFLELLFQKNYKVRKALNGLEAIACIRELEPDLVISDVMMPKMDGIELCSRIKSQLATCHIPVILLTAKTAMDHAIEGIGTGADDYIPKPFNAHFLQLRVEKLIESQKRLLEKFRFTPNGSLTVQPHVTHENLLLNPREDLFIEKITQCIKEQINNESFSVVELGATLGMSRSNLFRKLKAITGQTPIEFIYYIRLNYSVELLLERKLNISEIAYEVGFKNPSSFSKSFRKQFGKSPSVYLNDRLEESKQASNIQEERGASNE
ncbi:signal transduction histidine kinase [Dyadobacter jejuensis]|uniref:histidine kinase n=1 Tax=Dyadobacter jejuensis TaxID=1082580 RepID=A0A316AGZ0_9BACT|nr:hybrid sensor histidine kinase/response regulator transcription factor [Dyadobacter jejuensis]PWJ56911.1 signal transduction histidine kinase [Dyadobacter jejuensis]